MPQTDCVMGKSVVGVSVVVNQRFSRATCTVEDS